MVYTFLAGFIDHATGHIDEAPPMTKLHTMYSDLERRLG